MAFLDTKDMGLLHKFSDLLGTSEPSLRLLLSLLASYPFLFVHKQYFRDRSPTQQYIYFLVTGIAIGFFNNGFYMIHSFICVLLLWLLLVILGGTLISVVLSFLFLMGYLLSGYYATGTDTYDIKWTMPQCVLTLRLIALSFDLFDGSKNKDRLSLDEQKSALTRPPSLLEIASHVYFPASYMVGPQFSMRRYQDFINRSLYPSKTPSPCKAGIMRGIYGLVYLVVYQVGIMLLPDSYLLSQPFLALPFWKRFFVVGLWGKISLYKYISCWLITEGACIFSGLAFSGFDQEGRALWKGCSNVRIFYCEAATSFGTLIQGFNINTNAWVAKYIYKRLKFLNNKYVSQVASLLFLAVWHGFHSGYYACFFMEFIIMYAEKRISLTLSKFPKVQLFLDSRPLSYFLWITMKIYVFLFMGYSLGSFVLLKSRRWWGFYSSLYFVGHLFFLSWILLEPIVHAALKWLCADDPPPAPIKDDLHVRLGKEPSGRLERQSSPINNRKRRSAAD